MGIEFHIDFEAIEKLETESPKKKSGIVDAASLFVYTEPDSKNYSIRAFIIARNYSENYTQEKGCHRP